MQIQSTVTRDSNCLNIYFIKQKWFFCLVLLYFTIKKSISKNYGFFLVYPRPKCKVFRRMLDTLWKITLEWWIMPQIIDIFLLYSFVALTLRRYYKRAFEITKN